MTDEVPPTSPTVGDRIEPLHSTPDAVQLFLFSAATKNPHLIHYNSEHAGGEGYSGLVVQSHLHACLLMEAVLRWAGQEAEVKTFSWQNRHVSVAGDDLTVTGTISSYTCDEIVATVGIDLAEHNQSGELCTTGHATVALPAAACAR